MSGTAVIETPFNPYTQNISILDPDGMTQTIVPLDMVFALQSIATNSGIIWGIEIGACAILLAIMVMMTKPEKRRSVIFILNSLALLLLVIRGILSTIVLTGSFYNFYNFVEYYYVDVEPAIRVSVAAEVMGFLVALVLELSMMFQVHVVCCTLQSLWRSLVTAISTLTVLMVTAVHFAYLVASAKYGIVGVANETDEQAALINKIGKVHNISFVISIYYFSAIFCAKLLWSILQRRQMGLKQFGAMHIIFIMGCQTLFVPALFGILAIFVLKGSRVQILMYVILAAFLPLSSLWASTTMGNNIAAPLDQRRLPVRPSGYSLGSGTSSVKKSLVYTNTTTDTEMTDKSPRSTNSRAHTSIADRDVRVAS